MKVPQDIMSLARKGVDGLSGKLPVMVLTGAGISVESNIPHFRGPGGLWERYDPYEYGHIDTFREDPERTWKMLREIIDGSLGARPNEAHLSLARMEGKGWIGPVVTQNVDGLHREAGSIDVLEVHGNARRIFCPFCERKEILDKEKWKEFSIKCICGQIKRPDIVLFGEQLPEREIQKAFLKAYEGVDLLVIGTSGVVQPVASIPAIARSAGGRVVEINPMVTELTGYCSNIHIPAKASIGTVAFEMAMKERFS